jgi:hypothetical protein
MGYDNQGFLRYYRFSRVDKHKNPESVSSENCSSSLKAIGYALCRDTVMLPRRVREVLGRLELGL